MAEAPETLEGWYVLHDFYRLNWAGWTQEDRGRRRAVAAETREMLEDAVRVTDAAEGQSALYRVIGHEADLLQIHLRARLEDLETLERLFGQTRLAQWTTRTYSYVSVTELSQYAAGRHASDDGSSDGGDPLDNPYVRSRLKPDIPDTRYVSFYPMNKKRGERDNWYDLSMEERREVMKGHGLIGRKYAGKVTQMITGSVGFDDWEWGVTLFSDDPLQFKKLVYEMRFDPASSRYALFGSFFLGIRLLPAGFVTWLEGKALEQ